jgi:outer membrane protein assembly factor BamB
MDIGFDSFETSAFDMDIEEVEVKKIGKFERIFKIKEGGSVSYTLLVNNTVYCGSCDGYVYALNAITGEDLWRFRTGGIIIGKCAFEKGLVFTGSYDGKVYAINAESGKEEWSYRTGGEIYGSVIADAGRIYAGSNDGYLYCLDARTGKELWKFRTGDSVISTPGVYKNRVYIGSFDSYLYCLETRTGKEVWRFRTGDNIMMDLAPLFLEGKVYFASFDNYLYCLNCETGKEIWRFRTGKYGNNNGPVFYKNMLIHGSRDGILYAINMNGKEIWRFKGMSEGILTQASVYEDKIYFGTESGILYILDFNGKEISRFRASGFVYDPPKFLKDFAIFGSWDCHIYCISTKNFEEIWRFTTSNLTPATYPPPYKGWKVEVKKETHIEDFIPEEKYKSKKKGETVSLSDYHVASEYAMTSEYKQKSGYDTSFVAFEETLEETPAPHFLNKPSNLLLWTSREN